MATLRAELDAARRQLGALDAGAREAAALRTEHELALRTQAAYPYPNPNPNPNPDPNPAGLARREQCAQGAVCSRVPASRA